MPYGTAHLSQFFRGCYLISQPDLIPDGAFRRAFNIRIDRLIGSITNRPGWIRLTAAAAAAPITWLSKLFGTTTDYSYYQSGSTIYRRADNWDALVSIGSTGTADVIASDVNYIDGKGGIWKYMASPQEVLKDNGTTTAPLGYLPPEAVPQAVALAADLTTTIDAMNAAANWTGAGLASGPANEATIKIEGANSVTFQIAASGLGSIARTIGPLNLDTLTNGDNSVKEDDYIHLWVRIDRPDRVEWMQIDFDLDGAAAFTTNYYSARVTTLARFNLGRDQWNRVQIRKSEFSRFGTSTETWANVDGVRVSFRTNSQGAAQIYLDDFKLRGGVGVEGDIEYTVTYRDADTGGRSNPPKNAAGVVLYTSPLRVDRQRVTLTLTNVAEGGVDNPGQGQVDTIMIWRRGSSFASAVLVTEIADTTGSYTDNTSDTTLALNVTPLEDDNDPPPLGAIQRFLFGPDAAGHLFLLINGHRLYFSKPFETDESRAENWPSLQFALIGTGSERAVTGIATDTETIVFTERQTYQLQGAGPETFLPVAIPDSRECLGQNAVTSGAGVIFFVANDGIYSQQGINQRKLTGAIDPFFNGITVDGVPPLSTTATIRALTRLQYHPDPQGDSVIMLYAAGHESTPNSQLILKRNFTNGEFTECFFADSTRTDLRSLYLDTEKGQLLAGGDNGHVYRIEDYSTSADDGLGMTVQMRTKSLDFQAPQSSKKIATVEVEANTRTRPWTVAAFYDRNTVHETLGTITTDTAVGAGHFDTADSQQRRQDCAIDISGLVSDLSVISRISIAYAVTPEGFIFLDSDILGSPEVQQYKFLEFDLFTATAAQITVTVYTEGIQRDQRPFFPVADQRVYRHYLPSGIKGYTFRVTLQSSGVFELFGATLFSKALGSAHGYQQRRLQFAA